MFVAAIPTIRTEQQCVGWTTWVMVWKKKTTCGSCNDGFSLFRRQQAVFWVCEVFNQKTFSCSTKSTNVPIPEYLNTYRRTYMIGCFKSPFSSFSRIKSTACFCSGVNTISFVCTSECGRCFRSICGTQEPNEWSVCDEITQINKSCLIYLSFWCDEKNKRGLSLKHHRNEILFF